jgi:phosphohistidine phosphatase SixA
MLILVVLTNYLGSLTHPFQYVSDGLSLTALIMLGEWGLEPDHLEIYDSLYLAYVSEIEEVVSKAPSEIRNLAIYGHNPSFTLFANQFLQEPLDNLPTAGVVIVTFDSDTWKFITRSPVKGTFLDFPKRRRSG